MATLAFMPVTNGNIVYLETIVCQRVFVRYSDFAFQSSFFKSTINRRQLKF